jgi:hypothetical protein
MATRMARPIRCSTARSRSSSSAAVLAISPPRSGAGEYRNGRAGGWGLVFETPVVCSCTGVSKTRPRPPSGPPKAGGVAPARQFGISVSKPDKFRIQRVTALSSGWSGRPVDGSPDRPGARSAVTIPLRAGRVEGRPSPAGGVARRLAPRHLGSAGRGIGSAGTAGTAGLPEVERPVTPSRRAEAGRAFQPGGSRQNTFSTSS